LVKGGKKCWENGKPGRRPCRLGNIDAKEGQCVEVANGPTLLDLEEMPLRKGKKIKNVPDGMTAVGKKERIANLRPQKKRERRK